MSSIQLSILIPTFNYKSGINKILNCLKSTKTNLRDKIEIIISDDSDNKILDSDIENCFLKSFGSFKYIHNKKSMGGVSNWNKLISIAKGKYYWLLHHDEYWEDDKKIINFILKTIDNQKPNLIIIPIKKNKKFQFKNYTFELNQKHNCPKKILKRFVDNPKLLLEVNTFGPPSVFIYKKCKTKYDINLCYLVDVDFYIRILESFSSKKVFIAKSYYNLISSQNNNQSITKSLEKKISHLKNLERRIILNKYNYKFKLSEKIFILYSFMILKFYSLITIRFNLKKDYL